jgi:hypothetical protein
MERPVAVVVDVSRFVSFIIYPPEKNYLKVVAALNKRLSKMLSTLEIYRASGNAIGRFDIPANRMQASTSFSYNQMIFTSVLQKIESLEKRQPEDRPASPFRGDELGTGGATWVEGEAAAEPEPMQEEQPVSGDQSAEEEPDHELVAQFNGANLDLFYVTCSAGARHLRTATRDFSKYTVVLVLLRPGDLVALLTGFGQGVFFFDPAVGRGDGPRDYELLADTRNRIHAGLLGGQTEPFPVASFFKIADPTTWQNLAVRIRVDFASGFVACIASFLFKSLPPVVDAPVGLVNGPVQTLFIPFPVGQPTLAQKKHLQVAYAGLDRPSISIGIWCYTDTSRPKPRDLNSEPVSSMIVRSATRPPKIRTHVTIAAKPTTVTPPPKPIRFAALHTLRIGREQDNSVYDREIRKLVRFFGGMAPERIPHVLTGVANAYARVVVEEMREALRGRTHVSLIGRDGDYELLVLEHHPVNDSWVAMLRMQDTTLCVTLNSEIHELLHAHQAVLAPFYRLQGNRSLYYSSVGVEPLEQPLGMLSVAGTKWSIYRNKIANIKIFIASNGTDMTELVAPGTASSSSPEAAAGAPALLTEFANIRRLHDLQWPPDDPVEIVGAGRSGNAWCINLRAPDGSIQMFYTTARGYCDHDTPLDVCPTCASPAARAAAGKTGHKLPAPLTPASFNEPCHLRILQQTASSVTCAVVKDKHWQFFKDTKQVTPLEKAGRITVQDTAHVTGSEFKSNRTVKEATILLVQSTSGKIFKVNHKRKAIDFRVGMHLDGHSIVPGGQAGPSSTNGAAGSGS